MRAPVRMLDGRRVIVVVIVVFRQVDVRLRQYGRDGDRRYQQRRDNRPTHLGRNHAENLTPLVSDETFPP